MKRFILAVLMVALSAGVTADEGMWTFDNVPKADIAKRYGVQLTDQWLAQLQKSVVRLETGCTGSFVSAEGLVLTNHHCVAECLADNSSAQRDLMANGYIAARREDELVCQGAQASVLMSTENVTDRVTKAIAGVAPGGSRGRSQQGADDARSGLRAGVEESGHAAGLRIRHACIRGDSTWLYKYKRYDDVRLAFAPDQGDRRFRRRPGQFPVPALVSRHVAAARVRERQAGIHAGPSDVRVGRRKGRRAGVRRRSSGHDASGC